MFHHSILLWNDAFEYSNNFWNLEPGKNSVGEWFGSKKIDAASLNENQATSDPQS